MAALAVIVALAAVAAVAGRRWPGTSATRISGQDMILLAGIENRTGEPVFQDTLSQALGVQLAQSPYLNLVPEDRVRETLRQMGRGPEERPTGEVARELCQRLRLKAMVEGSVSRLGRSYALLVQARACETGDSLAHAQGTASSKEEVLHALGTVSASLRQTLGESLKSVEQYNVPVAQATTPSLDALRAYTLGVAQRARGAELESIPFLERALTLDPNFAAAATTLSTVYGNLGEWRRAEEHARIAYANRDRVSERERLFITYQFHDRVTGDQVAAAETLSVWKATFPGDFRPSNLLAIVHNRLGRFDQGVAEAQEALHRSPKHPFPLSNLAYAYRGLGEFDKARKVAEQAVALGIATVPTRRLLYQLAVLQGDAKGAAQQREWARGNPREFDLVSAEAQVAAYHGRMVEARELYRTAMQMAIGRGLPEWAAAQAAHAAWTEALYGNADRALAWAREALRADEARETTALANPRLRALITFALLGARETPSLVAAAVSRYPDSTFTRGLLLPSVRGTEAIHRRDWNAALAELKAAEPYELGYSGVLIPVYLRALANLARGDGPVAAADFQKMIRHRGSDPFSPMVALAHLGLARAKRLAGDTGGSAAAFERFLELWKNADADLPVFLDAAREHRALVATRNSTE
jgi:tetratricopeptide (TPR) repeat protein